jgi:transcriptional regulator with XRE-family HTH domain
LEIRLVVAKNLRAYRVRAGLTQADVAERAKVNVRHLSQMENHGLNLTLDTLERLATAVGVVVADLVADRDGRAVAATEEEIPGLNAALRLLKGYRDSR